MAGLLLTLVVIAGSGSALPRCDMVEINHYQPDDSGGFTQVIAWDWDSQYRRWHAQQWAIVSDWSRSGDVTRISSDGGESVSVRSKLFRETWSRTDPERGNGALFGQKFRRRVW